MPLSGDDLLAAESGADLQYGFPLGTMRALGITESANGANTGSIGNIFQVLPSTAAQPGYGLSSVDGNDPLSAGAYLAALRDGPAGGDLGTALQMYHGGAGNPTPYSAGTEIAQLVPGAGGIQTMTVTPESGGLSETAGGLNTLFDENGLPRYPGDTNATPPGQPNLPGSTLLGSANSLSWWGELATRIMLVLVGLVLIGGGFMIAGRRSAAGFVEGVAGALPGAKHL